MGCSSGLKSSQANSSFVQPFLATWTIYTHCKACLRHFLPCHAISTDFLGNQDFFLKILSFKDFFLILVTSWYLGFGICYSIYSVKYLIDSWAGYVEYADYDGLSHRKTLCHVWGGKEGGLKRLYKGYKTNLNICQSLKWEWGDCKEDQAIPNFHDFIEHPFCCYWTINMSVGQQQYFPNLEFVYDKKRPGGWKVEGARGD